MWVNIEAISTISESAVSVMRILAQGGLQRSASLIDLHKISLLEHNSEPGHIISAELHQSNWDPRARESHSVSQA